MYQGNCGRCGRKVRTDENYLKAHLWASTAVFHWARRRQRTPRGRQAELREAKKQKLRVEAATPGTERNRR